MKERFQERKIEKYTIERNKNMEEKDMRICPVCGKEAERNDMNFTRDCHGITFRLVCYSC
jgi:hypothetical protein